VRGNKPVSATEMCESEWDKHKSRTQSTAFHWRRLAAEHARNTAVYSRRVSVSERPASVHAAYTRHVQCYSISSNISVFVHRYMYTWLLQSAVGRSTKVCYRQVAAGHECCSVSCERHEEVRPRLDTPASLICVSRTCKLTVFVVHWRCVFLISTRHIERIRGAFCDDALYKLTFTFRYTRRCIKKEIKLTLFQCSAVEK